MNLEKKITSLVKQKIPLPKANWRLLEKCALYDYNGTLENGAGSKARAYYRKRLAQALAPLGDKKQVASIVAAVYNPPRGSKARNVYYDLLEIGLAHGDIKVELFAEVKARGHSALSRDKLSGLRLLSLSRGTQTLMDAHLHKSGLAGLIERIYSTDPYGGSKDAQCYFLFFLDLLREGALVVKSYEDEWQNFEDMFAADLALAIKLKREPPFKCIWVDRKGQGDEDIEHLEKVYEIYRGKYDWKKRCSEVFEVVSNLR